jgi:nitrogen-specific signal transduction histidine kinase
MTRACYGQIRVETRPGETNFQVTLPVSLPKQG